MVWPFTPWYPPPAKPTTSTKTLHLTLTTPPTLSLIQSFESDFQIYGPGRDPTITLTFREQTATDIEFVLEGLVEEKFDPVADVVERWVEMGRCRRAWMDEEGELSSGRRWDLKT